MADRVGLAGEDTLAASRDPSWVTLLARLFGETGGTSAEPREALVTPLRFAGLVLLGASVLALRRPEGLLAPRFFAEDGAIFFRGAFEHPFWTSLVLPHAGYPELVPRLLAALAEVFPLSLAPGLYAGVSLVIASIALSWISLPQFRHWIPSDAVRCYLALLLWVAPNQEALMKLSYVHWYLCLWVALCAVMRPLRSPAAGAALVLGCVATFWSTPVSYVLLPLFLLRAFCLRARRARHEALAVLVGGLTAVASAWWLPWGDTLPISAPGLSAAVRLEGLVAGLVYKVGAAGILGEPLAGRLLGLGFAAVVAVVLVCAAGVGWLATRRGRSAAPLLGVCLYVILSTCALFVLRAPLVQAYAEGRGLGESDRYFFVASCFLLVLIVALAAPVAARRGRWLAAGMALLAVHVAGFGMRSWTPSDYDWQSQVERIEATRKRADQLGRTLQLVIPIDPKPWQIRLRVAPGENAAVSTERS